MASNANYVGEQVVFVHPDGRELPAVVTGQDGERVDLVVFDASAPGGTHTFAGVEYTELLDGGTPIRHTFRLRSPASSSSDEGEGE